MRKDETKFHTKLMRWLKYNKDKFPQSFLGETKVCRLGETRFNFNELTEKEENLLLMAKHRTMMQTHSDFARTGTNCDFSVVSGGGFIFIQWVRRGNKEFYCIDIDDFVLLKKHWPYKSITEPELNVYLGVKCKLA